MVLTVRPNKGEFQVIEFEEYKLFATDYKLIDLSLINPDTSIIIYISHASNLTDFVRMYDLIVNGIQNVNDLFAPTLKCYIWINHYCLIHPNTPPNLFQLFKYVDCLFTPIYSDAVFKKPFTTYYDDYLAQYWNLGTSVYLKKSVSRLEMFYASTTHRIGISNSKIGLLKAGLKFHISKGRIPHILYSLLEDRSTQVPRVLPPIFFQYYNKFDPCKGSEQEGLSSLIHHLQKIISSSNLKLNWNGPVNIKGDQEGNGICIYPIGGIYTGPFIRSKRHGLGIMIYPDGNVYEGYFMDDKRHGKGCMTFAEGNVYEGDFRYDKREGKGNMTYARGASYTGEFQRGKFHGQGSMRFVDGTIHVGLFKNGVPEGYGKATYIQGAFYEGDFYNGKKQGQGKMTYSNGDTYTGAWNNGDREGIGKFTLSNGEVLEGYFLANRFIGPPPNNTVKDTARENALLLLLDSKQSSMRSVKSTGSKDDDDSNTNLATSTITPALTTSKSNTVVKATKVRGMSISSDKSSLNGKNIENGPNIPNNNHATPRTTTTNIAHNTEDDDDEDSQQPSTYREQLLSKFCTETKCDVSRGVTILDAVDWNLDAAIELYKTANPTGAPPIVLGTPMNNNTSSYFSVLSDSKLGRHSMYHHHHHSQGGSIDHPTWPGSCLIC